MKAPSRSKTTLAIIAFLVAIAMTVTIAAAMRGQIPSAELDQSDTARLSTEQPAAITENAPKVSTQVLAEDDDAKQVAIDIGTTSTLGASTVLSTVDGSPYVSGQVRSKRDQGAGFGSTDYLEGNGNGNGDDDGAAPPPPEPEIPLPSDVHESGVAAAEVVSAPAVSGSRVVWSADDDGDHNVYMYDGIAATVEMILDSDEHEMLPAIDGDTVVYVKTGVGGDTDIWALNLATGENVALTEVKGHQTNPDISGDIVVWEDRSSGWHKPYIYKCDLTTGLVSKLSETQGVRPRIDGDTIVFQAFPSGRSNDSDIHGYDLASSTATIVASSSVDEMLPAVGGEWVAWVQYAEGGADVWAARLGEPGSVKIGSVGEQTLPAIGGDTLYAIDNIDGSNVVIRAVSLSTGWPVDISYPAKGSVAAVAAAGTEYAWLEGRDGTWRIFSRLDQDRPDAEQSSWCTADWSGGGAQIVEDMPVAALGASLGEFSDGFSQISVREPYGPVAAINQGTQVRLTWQEARGATSYEIYRATSAYTPIFAADLAVNGGSLSPVWTGTGLSADVAFATDEQAKKFTYYYVVVSVDGTSRGVSTNVMPDPHRSLSGSDGNFSSSCMRCHSVHGSTSTDPNDRLGALGAFNCYGCHGSTDDAKTYGAESVLNVQREMNDYVTQSGGSKHYNAFQTAQLMECDGCHNPHLRPYNETASISPGKLLKAPDGSGGYTYSYDSNPWDDEFCFECHGTTSATYMNTVGGTGAYDRTAGDHNEAGFDSVAHMPTNVPWDAGSLPNGGDDPANACYTCHNRHGSNASSLIDYRETAMSSGDNFDQAELCFSCHENYATEVATYGSASSATYFAWNGRDPRTQFAKGAGTGSSHPTSTTNGLTCYSCHNTHNVDEGSGVWDVDARASDPNNIKNAAPSSPTTFCMRCHDGTLPQQVTNSASTLVPYTVSMSDMSSYDFFPGWDKTGFTTAGHKSTTMRNMDVGCDNCHDPHASDNDRLTAFTRAGIAQHSAVNRDNSSTWDEEDLCYGCHTSDRTPNCAGNGCHTSAINSINVESALNSTYAHPTNSVSGKHSDTEDMADVALADRHAECVDCHDPHLARPGTHTQGQAAGGPAVRGATGVDPTYGSGEWASATGYSATSMTGASTDYEAYVCLKCHSDYTTLPSSTTDLALQFNPNNEGGHNVMGNVWPKTSGVGAANNRTWSLPSDGNYLDSGWTSSSMVTCSDCHTGNTAAANGPHGSSVEYIIDPAYPTAWADAIGPSVESGDPASTYATTICNKCHDDSITGMNEVHDYQKHFRAEYSGDGKCISCHVKIPHGWKRPRLIGYRSDPAAYSSLSLNSMQDENHSPNGWSENDCGTSGCDSHSTNVTPAWP